MPQMRLGWHPRARKNCGHIQLINDQESELRCLCAFAYDGRKQMCPQRRLGQKALGPVVPAG
jgi:hypothetical protein